MHETTANREGIKQAINEMIDELTENELLELEDFIVNECENEAFVDNDGNYLNLFRTFITGHKPD